MLKVFLKNRKMSIYKLAQLSEIPYSTLNDMVNHKVDINSIRTGIVYKLSKTLGISMDELYELCNKEIKVIADGYAVEGWVFIKNKTYFVEFEYHGKEYIEELYPVKKEATMFIETIAQWHVENRVAELEREELYELYFKKKR